jgi:ABC-type glycerol-3-phosphate transport system substrate-binding protein
MWALAGPSPESQEAAAQLAEFLSESDFLGEWTETTGYLPPRPSALSDWQDSQLRTFIRQASLSAHLVPSADVLPGLAAPLVEATAEMLKLENDPATAAREAVESLQAP